MKKTLVTLFLAGTIGLLGCMQVKTEYSESVNSIGTIIEKKYVEEQYLNPIDNINPMKDLDPAFDLKKGRIATKQNEKFNVSIATEVGIFTLNNKDFFNKVEVNSFVEVSYREKFRSAYKDIDKDGKKDLVEKISVGYDLLDAQPREE